VIGDFRFDEQPSSDDVVLELTFSRDGERLGTLSFGSRTQRQLDKIDFPAAQETLPLASALPYAIAVAIRSNTALVLTGDPSAWDPGWGTLRKSSSVQHSA
jgi:hypothetical protein